MTEFTPENLTPQCISRGGCMRPEECRRQQMCMRPAIPPPGERGGSGTVFACAGCGRPSNSLVGKQVDGAWYCYDCSPARTATVSEPRSISSKQLTRYDTDRDGDEYATDTGPYVHYTDAQAEIERLSRQVGLLQKSRDEYYEAYWKLKNSGHERTPDVVKACHATIGVLARRVVQMGQPLRDHACAACMPEGGPLVTVGFTCAFHLASYLVTCPEYQLPDSGQKAEPLQGPYCPDTNQPCDRMCQSICNRRECAHEFLPTAGQALSETDPRCIKCHRRWSSVNGRP